MYVAGRHVAGGGWEPTPNFNICHNLLMPQIAYIFFPSQSINPPLMILNNPYRVQQETDQVQEVTPDRPWTARIIWWMDPRRLQHVHAHASARLICKSLFPQ